MGLLEIKAILGQERRTVSDSRSHMYCLFQKLLQKAVHNDTSDSWLKGNSIYFNPERAQKQQEVDKVGQQGESHACSSQRGRGHCQGKVLGKGCVSPGWLTMHCTCNSLTFNHSDPEPVMCFMSSCNHSNRGSC